MFRTLGIALAAIAVAATANAADHSNLTSAGVRGLSVSHEDPSKITVATNDGQWMLGPDGEAERVEDQRGGAAGPPVLMTLPTGLNDMVSVDPGAKRVYAATDRGLMLSPDGGVSWVTVYAREIKVSAVQNASDGWIYAYVAGEGVVRSRDPSTAWLRMGDPETGAPLARIAVDPQNPRRLVAADANGRFVVSADSGRTWRPFVR